MSERKVSTDALETLGLIIDENQKRDAIHLAVLPMLAAERLLPGQDIGVLDDQASRFPPHTGIVDPFLKAPVEPGQRFWMVLYPRMVTSLRHVWSHPAFSDEPGAHPSPPPVSFDAAANSEKWLRELAESVGVSYGRLIQGAENHIESRDYLVGGYEMEGEVTPDEFWVHYEIVTKKSVPEDKRDNFFSCSC